MRFLFLDDSGKIHPNDASRFAGFGGFSLDERQWHRLVRQVAGAKSSFYPNLYPHDWEVKSTKILSKRVYKKAKNRNLCDELLNIVERNSGHTYVVYLEKGKANSPLDEHRLVPLCFHRILGQFLQELDYYNTSGTIVCDWSTYKLDHHVTQSVKSIIAGKHLHRLVGGVTYGSSAAHETLQICDVVVGAYRRWLEGRMQLASLAKRIEDLAFTMPPPTTDVLGYPINSIVRVF